MSVVRFAESRPVARKAHRCNMCARMIAPGETYWASRNIYDGRVYTWKTCAHCDAAITATSLGDYLYDCDGYGPDDVAEWEPQDRRECVAIVQLDAGDGPGLDDRPGLDGLPHGQAVSVEDGGEGAEHREHLVSGQEDVRVVRVGGPQVVGVAAPEPQVSVAVPHHAAGCPIGHVSTSGRWCVG